jgi:tRNA dimethylallyltransferase
MQGYSILNVLTARPGPAELARTPHRLYGHVHPSVAYSTGEWMRDVTKLIGEGLQGRPIFVGGTGLYFRALIDGMSDMPDIPAEIRDRWRYELHEQGSARLHQILMKEDAGAAMTLKVSDGQRIVRALEVLQASGRSILDWQGARGKPLIDRESAQLFVIEPDRSELIGRIDRRFDAMIDHGALEEVTELCSLDLDPALPAMKAIGVRELQAAMAGTMTFPEVIERAKIATRQYSKRQTTWFRNQFDDSWTRLKSDQLPRI